MNTTGWLKGLQVTADGTGIVSHAGVALARALADNIGLTGGLSKALASDRLLVHDRGRVLADLACAIADGAEVISDFRVIGDQEDLFGLVASVPTAWRTLDEIARGGDQGTVRLAKRPPSPPGRPRQAGHTPACHVLVYWVIAVTYFAVARRGYPSAGAVGGQASGSFG